MVISCTKDTVTDSNPDPDPGNNTGIVENEWKDNPYKLNVVYFVPNDMTPVADYEARIEKIMFDAQEFFAINLEREGYGRTSFGLDLTNEGKLNIITITGQQGKSAYPYSGGGGVVVTQLEAYFNQHPDKKKSEHTLVLLPSTSGDPLNPGGVPFYGYGRYCFALDYEHMDAKYLGQNTNLGNLATKWIGGLVHEFGHGLNAPHNRELKSLKPTLGTALMGTGNSSYGKSPTFITAAHSAIFANSQTFRTSTRSDWYSGASTKITNIKGKFEGNKIIVAGNFTSNSQVTAINIWHDPHPAGAANQDYDALSYTSLPIGQDSLYFESSLDDFYDLNGKYQLRFSFLHENGSRVTRAYEYEFINNIPTIEVINTRDLMDRSTWSIIDVDSEEDNGPVSGLLDGDVASFWHTQWKNTLPNHPHYFVLDMGAVTTIKGFAFENRSSLNGSIKDFEMFKSNDGVNWTSIGTYSLAQVQNVQYVDLASVQSFRYMKLVTLNSHGDFSYTHLAELNAYNN